MIAICKKELRSFFMSMTGYAIIAFLIMFVGIYFMVYNIGYGYPYFSYTLSGAMLVLLVLIPVLTMRSFAEEKKNKTDQLIFTSPIKIRSIVLGKYLSMVAVFLLPNMIFCLFPLIIKMQGNASLLSDYISIFEFFLMGCTFIAMGMFFSSITESPVIAAVVTFGACLVMYIWDTLTGYLPAAALANYAAIAVLIVCVAILLYKINGNKYFSFILTGVLFVMATVAYFVNSEIYENCLSDLLTRFDISAAFNNAAFYNLFDLPGTIMNLSVICVFIFITIQSIEKRRWS